MIDAILVLNTGSSSLKFALFATSGLESISRGEIEWTGDSVKFKLRNDHSANETARFGTVPEQGSHDTLTAWLLLALPHAYPDLRIVAAGHRVVHGGSTYADPVLIDATILAALERLIPLAPGHQPPSLAAIGAVSRSWPELPQVACFDTAFHRKQPRLAQLFALPRQFTDQGILRYGFHGLSYEYIASKLPELAGPRAQGRVIVAHLGHGASLCAIQDGRSIATTMAFTPLDGLVMGRRCGSLDPGVVLYLLQERGMTQSEVADLLNERSGLLGVSGISDDVRELQKTTDPRAREALDLFAYRAAREMGSLVAALGGLDVLVFTGGIGENSADVRRQIAKQSSWLGARLDSAANKRHESRISASDSAVDIFAIKTDEEIVIAQATQQLVSETQARYC